MLPRSLTYEIFLEADGIFKASVATFCEENFLMHVRYNCYKKFVLFILGVPIPCNIVKHLFFELILEYQQLYKRYVLPTSGTIEKRQKAGKLMILHLETKRTLVRDKFQLKFVQLSCVSSILSSPDNEEMGLTIHEESNLIYCCMEELLYKNFWNWIRKERGTSVSDFIKERDSDAHYEFTPPMLDKIYDICGYLCGYRVINLIKLNRIKSEYRKVFQDYHSHSRMLNGTMALTCRLPAECLLFREHSGGLYYSKTANFNFIKIIQAIWMQCLTTDVLIIFNSQEPVKLVHKLILNSVKVQRAFKESCYSMVELFTPSLNLATDINAISFLYQFLIQGFVRVYAKDIYQLRLSNVLMSKTGASGIRTALLTLSASSLKNKTNDTVNTIVNDTIESNVLNCEDSTEKYYNCPCGKSYQKKSKTWYARHITLCTKYIHTDTNSCEIEPPLDKESVVLDNLIELECLENFGVYSWEVDAQVGINTEDRLISEENAFDASLVSSIVVEDKDDEMFDN